VNVDVLVVGGGPAGLTAARRLATLGHHVVVAEREQQAGGIPRHTAHLGYGVRDVHRVLSGPAYARHLVVRALDAGVDLRTGTTVLGVAGDGATLVGESGEERVTARAVLLATGVRERPRAARLVPGDRPAGVLTTGALQQFATLHQQRVGNRAVVVGAEHVSFSALLSLHHYGCEVAAMVTQLDEHQTYEPLRWATAVRHRVPILTGVDVASIEGRRRVEAVVLTNGTRIECDTVVFTGDWVPDHELARRAGCTMVAVAKSPAVTSGFQTSVRGLFAAGNLVHPAETADICALGGRKAAGAIDQFLVGGTWADATPIATTPPIAWATWSARGITLRVTERIAARLRFSIAGQAVHTTRPRDLVPHRSVTVLYSARHPAPDAVEAIRP
jgi:thioredoxin reductase